MSSPVEPFYNGPMDPRYPCRILPTRHCPAIWNALCPAPGPCARFESEDEAPWRPEHGPTVKVKTALRLTAERWTKPDGTVTYTTRCGVFKAEELADWHLSPIEATDG